MVHVCNHLSLHEFLYHCGRVHYYGKVYTILMGNVNGVGFS